MQRTLTPIISVSENQYFLSLLDACESVCMSSDGMTNTTDTTERVIDREKEREIKKEENRNVSCLRF